MPNTPDTSTPSTYRTPSGTRKGAVRDPLNEPLTDPADLFTLFGRFTASLLFSVMTVAFLVSGDTAKRMYAVPFGTIAMISQFATIRLWRRLRDARLTAKAARAEALEALAQNGDPQNRVAEAGTL